MMVHSYYGIYQAERGKTTAEIRAADAQLGGFAAALGRFSAALAGSVHAVHRSRRGPQPAVCPAGPAGPEAG
jgi:hypothetical protein